MCRLASLWLITKVSGEFTGIRMKLSTNKFLSNCCRESYFTFFTEFWPFISSEKLVLNWHIKLLCDELQSIVERVIQGKEKEGDLCCNCPPGSTKYSVFSVMLQPWAWTRMPGMKFITGSYSERISLDLSRRSRDVVMSEKYKSLFPEIEMSSDQNTKHFWVNTKGGMRYVTGVGGSVTGLHSHAIIVDDPIDPQDVLSDLMIKEVNIWLNETLSQRKVDKMITPTLMVMQRLHQYDPTGMWIENNHRFKHIVLPAEDSDTVQPVYLRQFYKDGLLDSTRLPRTVLEEAYKVLGEVGYAGQFMQNPVPRGGAMFKVDRLMFDPHPPSVWKIGPIRYWDKAIKVSNDACWTVGVKGGLDLNDNIWILDVRRARWDAGTRELQIQRTAEVDGRKTWVHMEQEPASSGQESVERSCHALAMLGYRAKADKVTGDKEIRADTFSVAVNNGRVILVPGLWNHELVEELRYFPNSRYKDQTDACAGLFGALSKKKLRVGALR
jgi:predicted phage terminase large subunit-like protein